MTTRERHRLDHAHEHGYLDATCRDHRSLVKAHGLWCWRLKVPMVWFERLSPHSRFATVRLDMLTTTNILTAAGQAALAALGDGQVTAHDAVWRAPLGRAGKLGHAAFRAAIQSGNHRSNRIPADRSLKIVARKRASA